MNLGQPGNPDTSKITALYKRLSQEDESSGDSKLAEYANKNGFTNAVHFTDDGFQVEILIGPAGSG